MPAGQAPLDEGDKAEFVYRYYQAELGSELTLLTTNERFGWATLLPTRPDLIIQSDQLGYS